MPTIKHKKVKGKITILKALPYKESMVYIRKIGKEIFEWLLVFKGQIYSSYVIITPREGANKLTKSEIRQVAALLWVGATSTIDTLLGVKIEKIKKNVVKIFEKSRKSVERVIN